jgi:ornithine carbamoyltransferase
MEAVSVCLLAGTSGMGATSHDTVSVASPGRVVEESPSRPSPRPSTEYISRIQQGDHMRSILSVADLTRTEFVDVLERASVLKEETKRGQWRGELEKKTVALLFQKPSLRTRVSFEQGVRQLGGHSIYLSPAEVGLGEREAVQDVARVLCRYVDCVVARVNRHTDLEMFIRYSTVPVINALSDLSHPCQAMADLLTVREKRDRLDGLTLSYIGDGNNVAHSLILASAKVGMHIRIACPAGFEPNPVIVERSGADRAATGATLSIVHSPSEAATGADVLYTDVWASMGQEAEIDRRRRAFDGFRIDGDLLKLAKPDALVMHDLPAHRGDEITDEVIDGPHSVVFDQAENRLHAQKGLLSWLFGTK